MEHRLAKHLTTKQLTIASRCPSAPMTIGHAGTTVISLQGVSSVTDVGYCGSNCCTRATSLTICRSIRGWTTADDCSKDTGTTFLVATMQAHAIQCKLKGKAIMQANPHIIHIQNHTQMHVYICMHHTHHHRHGAHEYMCLHVHTY